VPLTTIDEALRRIRRGEIMLVIDDEDQKNKNDLTITTK